MKASRTVLRPIASAILSLFSSTFTVASAQTDTTAPTVASFIAGTATTSPVNFTVTFSEVVVGVTADDFTVNLVGGATGTVGTIAGTGAMYTVPVNFGGTAGGTISLTVKSSGTGITDAGTNAYVGGGTATSSAFTVPVPGPSISSLVPATRPVGRAVRVNGGNFVSAPTVRFNGVQAQLLQWSSGTSSYALTAVPSGATTGPVTVQTSGGIAISAENFVVVPHPAPPANDNFADSLLISGSSGTTDSSNMGATLESGEPVHNLNMNGSDNITLGGRSIWYRWVAPTSGLSILRLRVAVPRWALTWEYILA